MYIVLLAGQSVLMQLSGQSVLMQTSSVTAIIGRHLTFTLLSWCLNKDRLLLGQQVLPPGLHGIQLPGPPDIKVQVIFLAPSLGAVAHDPGSSCIIWPLHPLPAPPLLHKNVPHQFLGKLRSILLSMLWTLLDMLVLVRARPPRSTKAKGRSVSTALPMVK